MKKQELKKLSQETIKTLQTKLQELEEELLQKKLRKARKELENRKAPKNLKKDIAQIKTIIREKELIKEAK